MTQEITIKYEGGDADKHLVDMRLLGRSLQGFDQIMSAGIIFYIHKRIPKRGERAPVVVKTHAPKEGSQTIKAILDTAQFVLPLVWPSLTDGSSSYLWNFVSYIIKVNGGRKSEAKQHEDTILKILKDQAEERKQTLDTWMTNEAEWRNGLLHLANRLIPHSINAVAPIGASVKTTSFSTGTAMPTLIDEPIAEAIRSEGEIEISDIEVLDLKTDRFIHHNRRLNVLNPFKSDSYINAEINDPSAEIAPNSYSDAANRKATIRVHAKIAKRGQDVEKIYVLNFIRTL